MSATADLFAELERDGVTLWEDGGRLRYRAPRGLMTEARLALLRDNKDELLARLRTDDGDAQLVPDPDGRDLPFPLTEVQQAYLLGRREAFALGGVACHGYGELFFATLDTPRLQRTWQAMIDRHDMLRAAIDLDGSQRILTDLPPYEIVEQDARGRDVEAVLEATRTEMDHQVHDPARPPLFELRVTQTGEGAYLHLSIDFLIADFVSIQLLLDELHRRYEDPDADVAPLELSFRDYLMAERRRRESPRAERDRAWWMQRLDDLPPAPELPLLDTAHGPPPQFRRRRLWLDAEPWERLRRRAAQHGLTPSATVLSAFAEVIGRWSRRADFTLDLTLLGRTPVHPQVDELIGDFTGVELLAVRAADGRSMRERAHALQARLWEDLDHRLFTGVDVMRELARRRGSAAATFPVVFTSALGLGDPTRATGDGHATAAASGAGELGYGISQTPQVWLDCQVMERGGRLSANWDVRDGVLDDHLLDDAFAAFGTLLRELAESDAAWERPEPVPLPAHQRRRRDEVNATGAAEPDERLQDGVLRWARIAPEAPAVIDRDGVASFGEVLAAAQSIAEALRARGTQTGDRIAVSLPKGRAQIAAVLGVLLTGGTYVPIDGQPAERRNSMLAQALVTHVLTDADGVAGTWPQAVTTLDVQAVPPAATDAPSSEAGPDDLAYIIFTSGSTGRPKGVMVTHRAALGTVLDINRRLGVGPGDRVLGLASLGFDLSVYDLFGILGAGGTLVLPDSRRRSDPSHWAELLERHEVTVWNSVPAQFQMLVDHLRRSDVGPDSLQVALLSGDWIPVTLPDEARALLGDVRLIGLGGATEASIWSIAYEIGEVDPAWHSIPYGRPLTNQTFAVLDDSLRDCPDLVTGELYIGGQGVAAGYVGDEEQTARRFIAHPRTGERCYRTGDLGRYLPNGDIEFLGREDAQVKIRGHRIELAEIEATLLGEPAVGAAAVIAGGDKPLERTLAAFVEPAAIVPADDLAPPGPLAAARLGGRLALAETDVQGFLTYMALLNRLGLETMLDALARGGVFVDEHARHSVAEVLETMSVAPRYHRLVRRWLRALHDAGRVRAEGDGRYGAARRATPEELERAWTEAGERQAAVDGRAEGLIHYFRSSAEHLPELLRGESDPLPLLFPDGRADIAESLYRTSLVNRWSTSMLAEAVGVIAGERRGGVRVLEVGGGVGGATVDVLSRLSTSRFDYLFTDVSRFFVNLARERFSGMAGVRFGLLDLDRPVRGQGPATNGFDVVIAADVVHSTVDVAATLARLHELTAPGGWLLLQEMTRDQHQIMVSLELLNHVDEATGDFIDLRRGRDQTFLSREEWERTLADAGYELAFALPDGEDPLAGLGMQLFAARAKRDRASLAPVDLQRRIADRLPDYMVPARIEIVDRLPLTDNGKVDQRTLRAWLSAGADGAGGGGQLPETDLERAIAAVWSELMGVASVDRDRGFFDLGGESLIAAQIAGRMREIIPEASAVFFDDLLRRLLQGPTVAELADGLASAPAAGAQAPPEPAEDSPLRVLAHGEGVPIVLVAGPMATGEPAGGPAGNLNADGPVLELRVASIADAAFGARRLMSEGHLAVHLAGVQAGGQLALEVARCLVEAGAEVETLTVAGADAGTDTPEAYLGDLRVAGADAAQRRYWQACCLGELELLDAPLEEAIAQVRG
jgi:pyochelin synthetase